MAAKFVLFVCAQVLLVQSIAASCAGRYNGYGNVLAAEYAADRLAADIYAADRCADIYAADRFADIYAAERYGERLGAPFGLGYEYPVGYGAASYGGGLAVASSSPLPASGVSILSENAFEGPLAVAGQLPFLGTAVVEGALPTIGAGAVNYGCGNGNVGILNEGLSGYGPAIGAYGSAYGSAYGPGYGAYGAYGSAYGNGLGCGRCL
ncbi:unnamed protein product [Colias eurytheme]|nr:unnamed protein product [Colias eurytheme]